VDFWEISDREIFLQAYLRLAQMEGEGERRDGWLGQSLLLGTVNYDAELYPPPLLAKRAEIEKRLPKTDIGKKFLAAGWSEILVNGQPCKKAECGPFSLYPGRARITLLSDQWAPQTAVIDLAEVERYSPKMEAWAAGGCGQSSLSTAALGFADAQVFWGLNCERPEPAAVNLKSAGRQIQDPLPLFTTAAPVSRPIYKSPWFWAGVSAAVAIAIVASTHTKETKEPSTTYGY
jgi:hypothetical protein